MGRNLKTKKLKKACWVFLNVFFACINGFGAFAVVMEPGPSIPLRLQEILRRVNREEIRNKVARWHKILADASAKLSFEHAGCSGEEEPAKELKTANTNDSQPVEGKTSYEQVTGYFMMDGEASGKLTLLSPVDDNPPRNKSPVQQWVDSLPIDDTHREEDMPQTMPEDDNIDVEVENFTLGAEASGLVSPRLYPTVHVSNACGSDAGSHGSSVESLLEARKPDPEELLFDLGFGGSDEPDIISRIPTRFLQPSSLKGVVIDDFLKHQKHVVHTLQSGFSGYRGLTGPSHAMPSGIVGKIMDRLREAEEGRQQCENQHQENQRRFVGNQQTTYSPKLARLAHTLINQIKTEKEMSVLSPENRNWYENQGDKSPEPLLRRMIIGQKSFICSKDGSFIELPNPLDSRTESSDSIILQPNSSESDSSIEKFKDIPQDIPPQSRSSSITNSFDSDQLELEYRSLTSLVSQLNGPDESVDIGTEERFFSLSPEERRGLHVGVIEAALSIYQKRLKEVDLRTHLKDLLSGQLHKVTDLLDSSTSPSVVTIMKQMTSLLRHQESLRKELKLHDSEYEDGIS